MNPVEIVKIGKYKGRPFTDVPKEYAWWQQTNGNKKFYSQWLDNSRFNKHTCFDYATSPDGRFMERKLEDGTYIFQFNINGCGLGRYGRKYYLVDADGNYMRDLVSFGVTQAKQGAIDQTQQDWITLSPSGKKMTGKMLVSPYWEHFPYETYQVIPQKANQ